MATPPFKDDTFLARWLSGELSGEEAQELQNRPDFADYERMIARLDKMAPPAFDEEAEFVKLKSVRANRRATDVQQPTLHPRPRLIKRMLPWSAAAAVALLLVAWFVLRTDNYQLEALNGDRTAAAELADGSTARLNAGSKLAFELTGEERTATLNGEAYFEVEKSDVPFVVKTNLGTVWVLGTSFNVYSRKNEMVVSCTTGKVRVRFVGEAKNYTINPGQSVRQNGTRAVVAVDTIRAEQLDWLSGKSVFVNRPLSEILDELERQFDVTIVRPDGLDQEKAYDAAFRNDDLGLALNIALGPIEGFGFELKNDTVTFTPSE